MQDFIQKIPKCELHIHIEGSLEPALMMALGQRNNIVLPYHTIEDVKKAYEFENLQSFLDVYYQGAAVLLHEQDFYDLTMAYLKKCHDDNILHTEIFFDPQTHTERGIPFETVMRGIVGALEEGRQKYGVSSGLIMCFLRHLSQDSALRTLEEAQPFLGDIIGVGLDSSEVGNPPEKFVTVFQKARDLGLSCTAHAGEEGPTDYIWQALRQIHVTRIDHGVQAEKDPACMTYLAEHKIPLTVCPLSNIKLQVFEDMAHHNLKNLLDQGLKVTINSDDPAYFGGYLGENFQQVQRALNLSQDDIILLCRNAFEASYLDASAKQSYLSKLDDFSRDYTV